MSLKYTLEEVVSSWRQTARIASITSARLNFQKDVISVSAVASQQNLAREEGVKFRTDFTIQKSHLALVSQTDPVDISSEKLKAFGASTNLVAILREIPDTKSADKNKPRQLLEIWKNGYLRSSLDVALLEKHGKVYTDGTFGCFQLSPDEKQLVYIAEKKDVKKQSYLQFGISTTAEGTKVGAEYEPVEDWGEQLVGKSEPVICVFNVDWEPFTSQESAVKILEPSDPKEIFSPGQMIWISNNQLAGVALYHDSRRLGRIFCTNRSSLLFKVDTLSGEYEWFGSKEDTANCPRFSNGSVVYLKSKAFGPHHKEQKIVVLDSKRVIRQLDSPTGANYQGMYNDSFPDRCWSKDGRALVFSTPCKSSIRSYILNLDSGDIQQLSLPDGCTGSAVMDVLDDIILVVGVSLLRPDQLFIGRVDWTNLKSPIEWKRLTSGNELPSEHFLSSDLLTFKTPDAMEFEAMLVYRKNSSDKTPLIVSPHGGPHSVFTDQFKLESYFLTQLGFAVLYVNYRGSTGFGDDALNSLLGKIGVQDVQECHQATLEAIKKHTFLDKDAVFLWGGSHGGFLVTHLAGQFPDFYKGVSTRNPVTNLATMYTISDIPDWCIVESGLGNGSELEKILNPETLKEMFNCSPIKYVADVKAPILFLVGKVDKRVPPTQSIEYYRALLFHGKKAKMLVYEDNHSISQLPFNTDALVNSVMWFKESVNQA